MDTGSAYAHEEPATYAPEGTGYVNEAGIREEMVPNTFASEGEYREYLQDEEQRRRAGYEGQGYEPEYHAHAYAQGYPEPYADAAYPGGPSSYPPSASGPPGYATPLPHAQDGGALASGGPARGDGKYGYVPR